MQTTTRYPRLPELALPTPDETAEHYGLRAFAFVVEHGITATLPDDALQLATHVYRVAIARPDLLPATLDRFADADRAINATIRRRAALAHELEAPELFAAAGHDKPNLGPMAPLSPRPIVNPPAPARVALQPALQRADFE